jgi:outer membrane protein insertion porin family
MALVLCAGWTNAGAKVIDTVAIQGDTRRLTPASIRRQLRVRQGEQFDPAALKTSIKTLYGIGIYEDIEFYAYDETDSTVSLLLHIEEYPIVENIEFKGNEHIKDEKLEEKLALRREEAMTARALHRSVEAVKEAYREKGYLLAQVDYDTLSTSIPGRVLLVMNIQEGTKVAVEEITFENNDVFSDQKLKRKFKTKEKMWWWGGEFDRQEYENNLDSLMQFYHNKGYVNAKVEDDSVRYGEDNKNIYIRITIHEGRQHYFGRVFVKGNEVVDDATLYEKIRLKRGNAFSHKDFNRTKMLLSTEYRDRGYLWAQIDPHLQYRNDTIDITFEIQEGPPAIVHRVDIVGNTRTRDRVIRREIEVIPGQRYKESLLRRSYRDLMQLNYFDDARPDIQPNDDGTVNIVFHIQEKEGISQLQLGATYSPPTDGSFEKGFGLTFSTTIPNFRGAGEQLNLTVEYSKYRRNARVGFMEPWLFNSPTSISGTVFYDFYEYINTGAENDRVTSWGFRTSVGRQLEWPDDYYSIGGTYSFSFEHESGKEVEHIPQRDLTILRKGLMSKLGMRLTRNSKDLPTFPTQGSVFEISPEIAGLGGDYRFGKVTARYDMYMPLFWKFVLGTRTTFGAIGPLAGEMTVRENNDLFTGGGVFMVDAKVRGYPEASFGGGVFYDNRFHYAEGLTMVAFNPLIRFPIIERQFYWAFFADMANTWPSVDDIDMRYMHKGVGTGVRLNVPMLGLLGFDLGWRLDDLGQDRHFDTRSTPKFKFHFSMQQGF